MRPVCHECYQVYSQMADEWKKKPRALLSVASAPALGLIGQHISELPEEILGVAADTPPPRRVEAIKVFAGWCAK